MFIPRFGNGIAESGLPQLEFWLDLETSIRKIRGYNGLGKTEVWGRSV